MKKVNKFICIFFAFLLITGNMDVYAVSETLIKENPATVTEETKDEPEKKEQVKTKTEEKTEEKTTVDKPAEKPAEPKTSTNKTTESSQPPVEEKLFKLTVKNDSEAEFEIYQLLTVGPTEDLSWGDGLVPNKEDNKKEFEEVLQKAIEDEDITVFTDKYEEQIDKEKALETEDENLYEVKPGYYYLIGEKVLPQIIEVKEDTETEIQEKPEEESKETSEEASDEEAKDEQKEEVKEETEDKQDEEKKEESDKQSEKDVFKQTVDKTEITVSADKGIFPEGATLSVEKVEKEKDLNKIEKAIDEEKHVAGSFTYDIKILDKEGNEIQPEKPVEIAFANPLINSTNHETNVYHIKEKGIFNRLEAEKLENTSAENFVAKTDGFSYYTVEFTYNEMTYSMKGDTEIPLSTVLDYVGLTGTVSKVEGSNDELFSFAKKNDVWYVKANKAFQTDEWMKVTIDGIEYEIKVTDATTYRVEFHPMAGSCTDRIVTVTAGSSISSLPTPLFINLDIEVAELYNFTFEGWYTQPHGGTKVTAPYTPTADTILYAHWSYEREFEYTGAYQEWTAPLSGVYQIDITGGGGGYSSGNVDLALGGKGGSATGKATLTQGTNLYIAIGGFGGIGRTNHSSLISGGWNGGGSGGMGSKYLVEYCDGGGGGGATSICTALRGDGQLKNYSSYTSEVLMVAGGGGGGTRGSDSYDGGHGGGTTAGAGEAASSATFTNGTFGQGTNVTKTKTSGITDARAGNGGGGGGYTGGKASNTTGNRSNAAGYGGTGYVKSTLSDASTTTGGGAYNEDGTCTISLSSTDYDIIFSAGDGTLPDSYIYQNVSPGSTCTLPTPTRSGYTFDGWYTAASGGTKRGNGGETYTPTQTETLYAHWSQDVVINFADQTATKTFSTSAQTVNITAATGGSGDGFTYSKQSGSFSVSGTSITVPANTEVGTYTTVVRATDSTSGSYKDATYTITINKANISPTVSMSGWTYGGTASNPSVSGNPGSGTVTYQYKVSTAADSTYSTTKPSNAGTYTVRASIAATTNYNAGTATANFTIAKASNPMTYASTQSVNKTFSTSSQTATLTAAANNQGTVSYAINSQKTSGGTDVTYFSLSGTTLTIAANTPAGTYTVVVRATAAGNDNYNSGTKDSTVTVAVGNASITATPTAYESTYDGNAHSAQIKVNIAGATVSYGTSTSYGKTLTATNANTNYTMSEVTGTNVGTVTVYYKVSKANYNDVTGTTTIKINKANISPSVSMAGWTYGGTASNPSVSGNPGSGTVTYEYKVKDAADSTYSSAKPSNAGTYTVRASVAATTNYNAGTATTNFTIAKAANPLTYTATQSVSKSFSTSAQTATLTAATNNQGTLSYAINSQKDSGGTAVTYFSLSGTTLTVAANTPVGTYTVVVRATAAGNDNYNSGTKDSTVTVTVNKANISPTVSMSGWTYGGTASSPSVSGNPGSGAVTYEYKVKDAADSTYSSTKPSNAGTYTVRATVAATTSYNGGTATTNFTISKATPSLTFTTPQTVTKTFSTSSQTASLTAATGNQGTLSYAIQSQKNSGGTDVTCFSLSGTTLTIGANAQAGTYTVVVRATDAGTSNYNSTTKDATVNVTINKATMTVTPTPVEVTYDGNSKSAKIKVNIDGATVYYGDSTSYGKSLTATNANTDYTMSEVARTNTGTTTVYYKVTKSNYNDVTGSTTIKINNNTGMTLTPTAYTGTYDGSAHSAQIKSNLASTTIAYGTSTSYGKTVTAGTSNVVMSEVTRTENGITTVYYKGSKANYSDKTGSTTITINPNFSAQSKSVTYNPSSEQNVAITAATGGSTFEYTKVSGDFSISGTNIVVPAGTAVGTYSIVVKATDTTSGHNSVSTNATYTIAVNKANMTVTPTAYSAKYDGSAHSAKIKVNVAGATVSYGTSTSYGKTLTATNANTDYAMSEITGTNVDTTTVYYKVSKANYNDVTGSTTITISKQDITPTVTMNGWTYGGTASNPSVSGNPGGGAVSYEYKVKDAADSTYSGTKPSNAGTYTVKATVAATSNYNGGTATTNFTIAKAANPMTYTSTQSVSKTFSTSSQTATLTAAANNQGTVSYAINSQKTSGGTDVTYFSLSGTTLTVAANTPAGTYTVVVRATAAGNDNYNSGTKDSTVTVTVGKANISPTVSMNGWTYGGTASNPSVSGNPGSGTVTYEYKVKDAADSTYSSTKPSNAGTYTVKATVAATSNYNGGTATANFTISKANNPLSYTSTQSVSKTFSTSAQTASLTAATNAQGTLSYAINSQKTSGGTTVSYFTLSGTTLTIDANTPVDTYTVVVRATAAGNDNYNSGTKDSTVTVTVNRANISPSVSLSGWTYGGTANNPSVSGNPGSGAVTYEYKVKDAADSTYSSTKPSNAGTYTVRATVAQTANYNSGTATANFTISKANNPLSYVETQTVSKTFSTSSQTASLTAATGNQGTLSYAIQSQKQGSTNVSYFTLSGTTLTIGANTPAGTYTAVIRATAAGNDNYNSGTKDSTVTVTVNKANISPSVSISDWTYDGTASSPSVSGNPGSGAVTYEYKVKGAADSTYTGTKPSNAGNYTVRASVAATANYNSGVATKDFTIAKAANPMTYASTQSVSKTFNTSAQTASLTAATNAQGTLSYAINSQKTSGGTAVNYFSLSGTTLTIAANTPAGTYTVVIKATAAGNDNYNSGTKDSTVTVTIGKANISPTVTMNSWTYGGTASNPSVSGNPGEGTITYTYKVQGAADSTYSNTKPSNAGSYTVRASIAETANYNSGTATANFTISKANINPTVSMSDWTYGETASNPSVTGNSGNGAVSYEYKVKDAADSTYSSTKPSMPGSYTVKASIATTTNYNAGTATANFTIKEGTMTVTPVPYNAAYDKAAHSAQIKVNVAGATVQYGTSTSYGETLTATNANTNYAMSDVTRTNVGTTTVYYKVTKSGYKDVTGSTTITITDTEKPSVTITSTNNVASTQTVTIHATDNVGITAYYWGTKANPADSDYTEVTSTESFNANKTVNAEGKYYLFAKDGEGNTNSTNKEFYKTTFAVTHGSVTINTVITMAGNNFATPAITADTGYTAPEAWTKSTSGTVNVGANYTPEGNVNMTATCTANTNTITLNPNGGTYNNTTENTTKTVTYDATTNNAVGKATRTGYDFDGWYLDSVQVYDANGNCTKNGDYWSAAGENGVWKGTTDLTLKAKWTEHTATLTYDANGHGTAPASVTMKYTEETKAASAITATDGTFKCWNTKKNGSGTSYNPGDTVKAANAEPADTTLYAQWDEITPVPTGIPHKIFPFMGLAALALFAVLYKNARRKNKTNN